MMFLITFTFFLFFNISTSQICKVDPEDSSVTRATISIIDDFLKESKEKNVIFSPASITILLGMISMGAVGQTEAQINEWFNFNKTCLKDELTIFNNILASEPEVNLANYALMQKGYKIRRNYATTIKNSLNTTLKEFDFKSNGNSARETINNLVESETNGLIKDFLKQNLPSNTALMLLNTVTFLGKWKQRFTDIGRKDFQNSDGSSVNVPTMEIIGNPKTPETPFNLTFGYNRNKDKDIEVVAIPYDGKFYLVIILPKRGDKLEDISVSNTFSSHKNYLFDEVNFIRLRIPKFKIEHGINVKDILEKQSIQISNGNYEKISSNIDVTGILHHAIIKVDEEGTEAAGASAGETADRSSGGPENVDMIVDRPFAYMITDDMLSSVLFAGRVTKLN